ncbi:hypothetical protein GGS20DRAFT_583536 [Poronia punctata]|nr:hypothetical protein GGS20DRAFT_583536 [Poronia punctata]
MSFFRITLHRSAIGLPERTRGVLAALGLRKRGKTVFHPVTPDSAGMLMKVKELVKVEEVDRALSPKELRDERRPEAGFWIEKAVPRIAPLQPTVIATGGSESEDEDSSRGYVSDTSLVIGRSVLPPSYNANPNAPQQKRDVDAALETV